MIGPRPVALLFTILVLVMVALVVAGVALGLRRAGKSRAARSAALTAAGLIAWLAATSVAARGGFFLDFQSLPPRTLAAILPPLAAVLLLSLTRFAEPVLAGIPPAALVYLQSFRVVVEFALWWLVAAGVAPEIMSFHGRNFDILVGLSAPVVGYCCFTRRLWPARLALWWNAGGILILLNTVIHAQLATPSRYGVLLTEPPNTFIVYFPYIWLPAVLVPLAWLLHGLSIRQLAGMHPKVVR